MSASEEQLPLVLLVEDVRSYRLVFRRILANRDDPSCSTVRLIEAENSLDALQVLVHQDPGDPIRLVVSDDRMPGLSGVELLDIVGQRWPGTERILLSGYTTGEMVMDAKYLVLDKGIQDWVIRDFILKLAHGK